MIKNFIIVLAVGLFLAPVVSHAALPAGFSTEIVAGGLALPTTFDFAPDGRIFVAEKEGAVRVIKNGELLLEPFLTLSDINTWVDRGLIGLAVDPDFDTNGWIYLSYTYENNPADYEGPKVARIVRVKADGDVMLPGSMEVLVGSVVGDVAMPSCNQFATGTDCIPSDSGSHSGGGLRFGPDGMLYATLGDGAGFDGVDPNAYKAQDLDWLTGKVLRLNTDGTAPVDNPFYTGDPNANRSKVYAYGVRNSFRFDFRPLNGTMYLGDVGWNSWEEINVATPGANFAWPCQEGAHDQPLYDCVAADFVDPIHEWSPGEGTAAVVGGSFSGDAYPLEYQDNYFFGDFHASNIDRMVLNEADEVVSVETWFEGNAGGPVSILTGPDGSIYYIAIFTGDLIHLVHEDTPTDPLPPIARDDSATVLSEIAVIIGVLENDSDPNGDPIDVVSVTSAVNGTAVLNLDDTITYTSNVGYIGEDTFFYTLSDGVLTDDALVTVDVREGGDPTLVVPMHLGTVRDVADPIVGQLTTFTMSVENQGEAGAMLVDFELYETGSNTLIVQSFSDNEFIDAGTTRDFVFSWLPELEGTYRLSVGFFQPGWVGFHSWIDNASTFTVYDREPPPDPGGDPVLLAVDGVAVSNIAPEVGEKVTITTTITNTGGAGSGLVDIEVFDATEAPVHQVFFDNEAFLEGETRQFVIEWTPTTTGQFWIESGTFGVDWDPFYNWAWHAAEVNVVEGGPAPEGIPVYTDSIAPGWDNWSWDVALDPASTEMVFEGTAALKATFATEWAGVYLHTAAPIDASTVSTLTLALGTGTTSGQQLQVKIIDDSGAILHEELRAPLSPGWTEVIIPLSGLGAANISGVMIQGNGGLIEPAFYIDEVIFN